jgi:dTDP-4-dehydrorhamnose reductase
MKIVFFGSNGQVGKELQALNWQGGLDASCKFLTRADIDLTDTGSIQSLIKQEKPDWVVNASAYTAVDKAESEEDLAHKINALAPEEMARACSDLNIPFITISTDYVFDGSSGKPYKEDDRVCPVGAYGRTKVDGEDRVRNACTKYIILRTAWVYSVHGGNFVKTMLRLGEERSELGVVNDQFGCPTSASSIAKAIFDIIASSEKHWGTYHFCGTGEASWHEFANYIFDVAAEQRGKRPVVNGISTDQYPTPAKRPENSRLNCDKIAQDYGIVAPDWKADTRKVIEELLG